MPLARVYQEYRRELNGPRVIASARTGTLVVIGLNTAFLPLDYWSHPESFVYLAAVRLAWDAAMIVVFWALGRRGTPIQTMLAGLYLTGAGMLSVVGLAGPVTSSYWAGMMILFLGIPVILPLSTGQAALAVGVLTAGFVGLALSLDGEQPFRAFVAPTFFVAGAAIECVASTTLLERLRFSDFTRRREVEEARDHLRDLDRAKSRFTANIHHELRTPLTLTLAPLESLIAGEFGPVSDLQASYLKTMHVNAVRLLRLINDLLSLAKIEGKQLALERAPAAIGSVIAEIVDSAAPAAERKNVALSFSGDRDFVVNVDQSALEKVVVNLVGNALKFTESGGAINVDVARDAAGVTFRVADTGVGMRPADCEKVFDRFAQADGSSTRRHEGTGIGLSLSKELVELHGGRISAQSAGVGLGTTIHVWLPVGESDASSDPLLIDDVVTSSKPGESKATESRLSGSRGEFDTTIDHWERSQEAVGAGERKARPGAPSLVVCDDNPDMRRLLAHVLGSEFDVRLAANGREGFAEVCADHPDLVLTDVMMPVMSGIELCKKIKSDPELSAIPVVLVTSKADREMKIDGLEMGADDYVTKPFHSRELLARVRALVKVRALQVELAERNRRLEHANREIEKAMEELKSAEAQLVLTERLAAVGELAAGIAHEANNPVGFALTAARSLREYIREVQSVATEFSSVIDGGGRASSGALAMLREKQLGVRFDELGEIVVELSQIVEDGLTRTGKLVGDLRDFAAPQQGRRTLASLPDVFESSRRLLRHVLQEKGVSVERRGAAQVPRVNVDTQAIGQVFLNIIKNAGEAFEGEGGTVCVEFLLRDGGVLVEISDDGPGVSETDLERLFEPFFTTKEPGRGTGLGLSISRQVVEEHGGRVTVVSTAGQGTTFGIWLPLGDTHEA